MPYKIMSTIFCLRIILFCKYMVKYYFEVLVKINLLCKHKIIVLQCRNQTRLLLLKFYL